MSKPTIVLVPGAWHKPEIYSSVTSDLDAHDYPTVSLPLPSAGAMPPNMTFDEDVRAIRDVLTTLVELDEKEVILVVHSYTGMPGAEAPKGLGKKERQEKGLNGGVIRLVFIMAFAMPEGFQPTAGGAQMPEWMKLDLEVSRNSIPPTVPFPLPNSLSLGRAWLPVASYPGLTSPKSQKGIVHVDPEDAKRIFYNDIPSAKADEWASKLTHQSLGVYSSTQTYAAWRHIPSTYVIGERDQTTFTPQVVQMMIKAAKQLEPGAFDVVEKCDGDHCLMISRPHWLADVLRRAAGEVF